MDYTIKVDLTSAPTYTLDNMSGEKMTIGQINFGQVCGNKTWVQDIAEMHRKFGVNHVVKTLGAEKLNTYLKFRLDMVQEEVTEALDAFNEMDADGVVDALIDNIVFAIGTLDAFGIDAQKAWDEVHSKNMAKSAGVKVGRPNPYGFPDLIKPEGWVAPSHMDNLGLIPEAFKAS